MEASGITTDRREHDKGRTVATVAGNDPTNSGPITDHNHTG